MTRSATGVLAAEQGSGTGASRMWLLLGLLVVAGGAFMYWLRRRGNLKAGGPGSPVESAVDRGKAHTVDAHDRPPTVEELRADADAALVAVDDSIRASEQEVGMALADLGQDGAEPFTAALDRSKDELATAFALRRRAQSSEAENTERDMLAEVVSICSTADARLDDLVPRFDSERDLEGRVDVILAGLKVRAAALEQRLVRATSTVADLGSKYPPATVANVLDDLDQVGARLQFASASLTIGQRLLDTTDRPGAVARARAAEDALGQATWLLDWVDSAPQVLVRAHEMVGTLLTEAERDIAEVERLGVTQDLAARGRYAREILGWASEEVSSGEYDPLAMRLALEDTHAALGRALGPIRADEEARERAVVLLASAWSGARALVGSADRYVTTRRGAVGVEARTRLCEAHDAYIEGISIGDSDPATALEQLRTADALAEQARALAQQDEASYRNARLIAGGMGELGPILLGGILIANPLPAASTHPSGPGPVSFGGRATRGRRCGAGEFQE